MKIHLPTFALLVASLIPSAAMAQKAESNMPSTSQTEQEDRIVLVAKSQGEFIGFQFGDYLHATFREKNGKERSFFIQTQGIDYFLAQYRGRNVQITYEVVDQFVPEAGERIQLERIVDAQVGSQRYSRWWQEIQNKVAPEEIQRRYEPLVEKATQ